MYYLGKLPTADKRLHCTVLREAFNSFALKCFRIYLALNCLANCR